MSKIAFTTATGLGPLPRLVKEIGGPAAVRRIFQPTGISRKVVDNLDAHLPLQHMIALFSRAVIEVGTGDFGLLVGEQMSPADFGPWVRYVVAANTLGEMLGRVCKALKYHQNGTEMRIAQCGDSVRWSYAINCPFSANPSPFIDHVLQPMVKLVRPYTGLHWRPDEIEVAYASASRETTLSDKFEAPTRFGGRVTALAIDGDLMSSPRWEPSASAESVAFGDLRRMVRSSPPRSKLEKVASVVNVLIRSERPEIVTVTEKLNTSVRTLRRELNRDGMRFRDVVGQALFDHAVRLVIETPLPFEDIAREIGHGDSANFTRAFRRASGMPPSVYRTLHRQAV